MSPRRRSKDRHRRRTKSRSRDRRRFDERRSSRSRSRDRIHRDRLRRHRSRSPRYRSRSPLNRTHDIRRSRDRDRDRDIDKNVKLINNTRSLFPLTSAKPDMNIGDLSVEEKDMMKMMGFCSFDSTKGKKVEGNDVGEVHVILKRKYRQYMNRKGGFNRPLDFVA